MKCPYCGYQRFYIKDSTDEFEAFEFGCESGEVCFDPDLDEEQLPDIYDDTQIYCDQCAWNGKFQEIKK